MAAGNYFNWVRKEIESLLPPTAGRIVDVGSGSGGTLQWLKERYPNSYGIALEGNGALSDQLEKRADEFHILNLNGPLPDVGAADLILFLDVLEHLLDPLAVLKTLTRNLTANSTVIVSLPNVAHLNVSAPLFFRGKFEYQDEGILDRTHFRFFTRTSAVGLLNAAVLSVKSGLRSGLSVKRWKYLDKLTFGAARDRMTRQYVMAATRAVEPVSQVPIKWSLV
jgi:SAM-dependent methyltransferase